MTTSRKHYTFQVTRPEPHLGTVETFDAGALAPDAEEARQIVHGRYPLATRIELLKVLTRR